MAGGGTPPALLRGGEPLRPELRGNEARGPEVTVLSARDLS